MPLIQEVIHRPQRLFLRKALFQVHLWTGIAIGLYILIISLSGSAIVFQEEMENALHAELTRAPGANGDRAEVADVMKNVRAAYPEFRIRSLYLPTETVETFGLELRRDADRKQIMVYAHPATGAVLGFRGRDGSVLEWLNDLHHNLLAGKTGRLVNGFGGIFLGVLCLTGLVIWWPGIKNWRRALRVDFSKKWKRVNWDLHSATGLWTLLLIALWAVTGAYFTWSDQLKQAVNYFSPVTLLKQPESNAAGKAAGPPPAVGALIDRARHESPRARLSRISFPDNEKATIRISMARGELNDRRLTDNFYFDQYSGRLLQIWHRGVHQSAGDLILYWISPLHFGDFGGPWVKALWVLLGLAPALLFATGSLMWWNRVLSKRWARLKSETSRGVPKETESSIA